MHSLYFYLVTGIGLIVAVVLTLGSDRGTQTGQGSVPYPYASQSDTEATDRESLAARGKNIFLGRIDGVSRVEEYPTSNPDYSYQVTFYTVDVQKVIKGQVSDSVEVRLPPGEITPRVEERLSRRLRYVFVTGPRAGDGSYPVFNPDLGRIEIKSDQQQAELVAEFTKLSGRKVQQREGPQQEVPGDVLADPTIGLADESGAAGARVRISGEDWAPGEVVIYWNGDTRELVTAPVGPDGLFRITISVPDSAEPGVYRVVARGSQGTSAIALFEVRD